MDDTDAGGRRSTSPIRQLSPSRLGDSTMSGGEIDPETVRLALRDFAQSMKEAERERDEAVTKVRLYFCYTK